MKSFDGKTALITGGSSGIGLALACQLAAEGAHIWILARDPEKLENACVEINAARRSDQQQVRTIPADVADAASLTAALNPFFSEHGTPDLLINSAGITQPGMFVDLDLAHHRANMEINFFGTLHVVQAVTPGMIARGSGHIVNISSIAGIHGVPGYGAYTPSKFAVRGLTDVLYYELKPHGIQVSIVFPTDTQTPQLDYDKQHQPQFLKILTESNNKTLPAGEVAAKILRDVKRGRYLITPSTDAILFYTLNGLPWMLPYYYVGRLVADARRKLAKRNAG
jgi:3-dehydrosphinganine reductase